MGENSIEIPFVARYYDNGVEPSGAIELLYVFHGYGQLAEHFIKKFEALKERNIRVIAPEGLSHYYLEGSSGRVGASWMTRENRLVDIRNYLIYCNAVYEVEMSQISGSIKTSVLGFSQGAATVSRWISQPLIRFDRLILWAGLFPPDLPVSESKMQLRNKEVYFIYGISDPYLSDSRFKEQDEIASQLGVNPQVLTFEGVHTIDRATLLTLF